MSQSSILGGNRAPQQARGRDDDLLGPSDTSDTGSDIQGATRLKTEPEEGELGGATPVLADSDTDAEGTGERAEAVPEGARDGAESITGNDDPIESLADESSDEDEEEEL